MLRGALGLGGPGSPRRKGQQQQQEENGNGNGSRNGGGGAAKLAAVLDAAADDDDGALASPRGANGGAAGEEDLAATAAAEHAARARAEGAAADASRRLEVAQEQVHEYARARAQDAAEALAEAEAAVARAASSPSSDSSSSPPAAAALASLVALRDRLAQASEEAAAFAELTRADAERARRSAAAAASAAASGVGGALSAADADAGAALATAAQKEDEDGDVDMETSAAGPDAKRARESGEEAEAAATGGGGGASSAASAAPVAPLTSSSSQTMLERARFIPLRLTADERRMLALLKAALGVSQYTDKVDVLSWRSKQARVTAQIRDMCAILSGLVVASDYRRGQQLVAERNFADNAEFFRDCFEVGRRHKIMNPEKMRTGFGKLAYLLMDSQDPTVQELLEFDPVRPLRTVHSLLAEGGALGLLVDPLLPRATAEIASRDRPRAEVQRDIRLKERARESLASRYSKPKSDLDHEEVLRAIYSIADNEAFLRHARDPVDAALAALEARFSPQLGGGWAAPAAAAFGGEEENGATDGGGGNGEPTSPTAAAAVASMRSRCRERELSLAISGGVGGARLTHSHARQYAYVRQTLALWRAIAHDMFRLWVLAQEDLFGAGSGGRYRLTDTGQGLQRVQPAPRVGRAMAELLQATQASLGSWVGSSVVHLGDHNVPNALNFIDKYSQVPFILNPVVSVCLDLPGVTAKDKEMRGYVESKFGSVGGAVDAILVDFFRFAFDGSGADNFFDAGSCIDGRLTSAWNWCSKIEKKSFYNLFKVAGFAGFDGKDWSE